MKPHKPWRVHRRLIRAAKKIDRADLVRANFFNDLIARATKSLGAESAVGFWCHCDKMDDWPDVKDMFIKGGNDCYENQSVPRSVWRVNSDPMYVGTGRDCLLRVIDVETKERGFIWFPRLGQTIIPCREFLK